jgi:Ser/Thr protein kinase RdoA (MazF antagonist)
MDWLRRFQPKPIHYGLVHGDFEKTNFLILDGTIGLFDFDDSCYHWFAWDIACALWVFRNATPGERSRFLSWFLEGYSAVREPDAERLDGFTELVRLRTVALVLHRLRNPERFASEADSEWVGRTRTWLRSSWSW